MTPIRLALALSVLAVGYSAEPAARTDTAFAAIDSPASALPPAAQPATSAQTPSGTSSQLPPAPPPFQHAWSEANHDLAYKPTGELTDDQQRLFAFTAAQAWGADRIFPELRAELVG